MNVYYLGTSAALELLIEGKEPKPLAAWLTSHTTDRGSLCSSFLLHTKFRCAARRRSGLDQETVASLLSGINLIDISRSQLAGAARTSLGLRTADATRLTVTLDIRADAIITYDVEMQNATHSCNLSPVAPS